MAQTVPTAPPTQDAPVSAQSATPQTVDDLQKVEPTPIGDFPSKVVPNKTIWRDDGSLVIRGNRATALEALRSAGVTTGIVPYQTGALLVRPKNAKQAYDAINGAVAAPLVPKAAVGPTSAAGEAAASVDGVQNVDSVDASATHTKPEPYVANLNNVVPMKAPDTAVSPEVLRAAASIPTFQGGKTKMARAITGKVIAHFGENAKKIDTIIDYFGGSGSWGAYMAQSAFPNVKKLVIHEYNPERLAKIRLFNEQGNKIAEHLKHPAVAAYFDAVAKVIQVKGTFSGSAIANVIANRETYKKAIQGAKDAIGEDAFNGLLQAVEDQGSASFGKYGKGHSGTAAVADMTRRVAINGDQAHQQMQKLRDRGASIEYVTGDSYKAQQVMGNNVMAMVDPSYYATKGYNGVNMVPIETYNDTRKLLDRLKNAGNSVIYTDEAWWEKHDKNTGKTVVPADVSKKVDGLDAFGQLKGIQSTMGDFFRTPIATRMEVVGFLDGNQNAGRNAGTVGRTQADTNREATGRSVQQNARGVDTGAGQRAGSNVAQGDAGVSAAVPTRSSGLSFSKAAPKANPLKSVLGYFDSYPVAYPIGYNKTDPVGRTVAVADLIPTQDSVHLTYTDEYAKDKPQPLNQSMSGVDALPEVVLDKTSGKYILLDGHHRVVGKVQRGDTSVRVQVVGDVAKAQVFSGLKEDMQADWRASHPEQANRTVTDVMTGDKVGQNQPEAEPDVQPTAPVNTAQDATESVASTEAAQTLINESDIPPADKIRLAADLRNGVVTAQDVATVLGAKPKTDTTTIESKPADNAGKAQFSRTALDDISENDDLFIFKRGKGTTLQEVAKSIDPDARIEPLGMAGGVDRFTLVMPNGNRHTIKVRQPIERKNAPRAWYGYGTEDADPATAYSHLPGNNWENAPAKLEVWIDISLSEPATGGGLAYAIAMDYAHNTGSRFIGDPAALSEDALLRRPEHMLSNALKWGTTEHLAPHPRQLQGLGVPALKWAYGDDVGNIESLIDVTTKAGENRGTDAIKFDPKNGTFRDSDGEALDRDGINALGVSGFGKKALAGGSTLARQAFLRSVLRAISEAKRGTDGRPDGLLETVRNLANKYQVATRKIFYSRAEPDRPSISPGALKRFAESVRSDGIPKVMVADTVADLPETAQTRIQSEGINGVRGMFDRDTGNVWLVRENLSDENEAQFVLLHEAFHRGLAKTMGADVNPVLDQIYLTNKDVRTKTDALAKEVKISRREATEEVLADMAGEGKARDLKGWDRLVKLIRAFISKLGIDLQFTDDMVQDLVAGARAAGLTDHIDEGGTAPNRGGVQFSRTSIAGQTTRQYSAAQRAAMQNVGMEVQEPTLKERAQALYKDAGKKLAQGIADQFAPVKDISKEAYGLLRLAKGASGAFEVFLQGGKLKLENNVYNFDETQRGVIGNNHPSLNQTCNFMPEFVSPKQLASNTLLTNIPSLRCGNSATCRGHIHK